MHLFNIKKKWKNNKIKQKSLRQIQEKKEQTKAK